jgi:alpha,alpha-trehalase
MCWVALDRAIALADQLGVTDHVDEWTRARREIRAEILSRGWSNRANAFTLAFGSEALDASSLMMPIVGFLPATGPRMGATVDAIAKHLTDHRGLAYRYDTAGGIDGLTGREGTFLACTFWLAHAQALCGQPDQAHATFETAIGYANDVGLLAEEVDSKSGALLGNFPQAFSHIGLINAARAISQAQTGTRPTPARRSGISVGN